MTNIMIYVCACAYGKSIVVGIHNEIKGLSECYAVSSLNFDTPSATFDV